jgi:hypothetical protein
MSTSQAYTSRNVCSINLDTNIATQDNNNNNNNNNNNIATQECRTKKNEQNSSDHKTQQHYNHETENKSGKIGNPVIITTELR